MKSGPFTKEHFKSMEKVLKPLGFIQIDVGIFEHTILNRSFDFTVNSIEGIAVKIFMTGLEVGIEQNRQQIRDNLGL